MDRFEWCDAVMQLNEKLVHKQEGVKLYDGDVATTFDRGEAVLTPFRLLWRPPGQHRGLGLSLDTIVFVDDEAGGFTKSPKLVLHLTSPKREKNPGPVDSSPHSHIKLSFKSGGAQEFGAKLRSTLEAGAWRSNNILGTVNDAAAPGQPKKRTPGAAAGILGIERSIQARHRQTGENISRAFQDMSVLMSMASEMVALAKTISQRMRDRRGSVSDDETVEFKSALLRLGVAHPSEEGVAGSAGLAKEMAAVLASPLRDAKGTLPLADAYCVVNRARGLAGLVSPEDIIAACGLLESVTRHTEAPMVFKVYPSGLKCIQLAEVVDDDKIIDDTMTRIAERTSLSSEELAKYLGTSVILAQQRLLLCEEKGLLCRDDSAEGLTFYPNRFLFP